MKKSIYRDW